MPVAQAACGDEPGQIRHAPSIETGRAGGSTVLPDLPHLLHLLPEEAATADGACDMRRCHQAMIARDAIRSARTDAHGRRVALRHAPEAGLCAPDRAFRWRRTGYPVRSIAEDALPETLRQAHRTSRRNPHHEPPQRPRPRREHPRGRRSKGNGADTTRATFVQQRPPGRSCARARHVRYEGQMTGAFR